LRAQIGWSDDLAVWAKGEGEMTYVCYQAIPTFEGENAEAIINAFKLVFAPAGVEMVLRVKLADVQKILDEGGEYYALKVGVNGEPLLAIQVV
jgi:hypothetical protein